MSIEKKTVKCNKLRYYSQIKCFFLSIFYRTYL